MTAPVKIIGSYLSPYVRKVLVVLDMKGLRYEIDPIVPFFGDERFSRLSPLRRIPVLIDDRVTLADSSVICQYLEDRHPEPALYPADVADRARARWLEEYADTRMGDVFIWQLFNQVAINPYVFGVETDPEALQRTLEHELPDVLDYLEGQLPAGGFLFGAPRSRTSRSRASSGTPPSRATPSTRGAGPRSRASWRACWRSRPSRGSRPSKTG